MVLTGENVGQLVAESLQAVPGVIEHDGALPVGGLGQEESFAVPVFLRVIRWVQDSSSAKGRSSSKASG